MTWHHFHHFLSKVFHNFILIENKYLIENKNRNKLGQCVCQLGRREGRKAAYRKVSQHPLNPLRQLIFCVNFIELRDAQITGKILLLGVSAAAAAKSLQSCPTLCNPIDGSPRGSHPWDSPGKNTGVGFHFLLQCMKVKSKSEVAQSYPTLSDPMDCSSPGSSAHGIFQARVLEWVASAFSGHRT